MDDPDPGQADTIVSLEGAAQGRAFLTDHVALTATLGLGFAFADDDFVVTLGGQLTGSFGFAYYF